MMWRYYYDLYWLCHPFAIRRMTAYEYEALTWADYLNRHKES